MISVIVAVYNQVLTVGWLLSALKEQECEDPFEVVICDDGSSGELQAVVRDASRDGALDLRYVWQPDRGFRLSRSRNNAIREAQGDLLVFVDGDVLIERDLLARHAAAHVRPKQIVAGVMKRVPGCRIGDRASTLEDLRRYDGPDAFPESQAMWARSPHPWMSCLSSNMSVPRAPEVRFDEQFVGWGGEDRELAFRLTARDGYELVYASSAVVYHPDATSGASLRGDANRLACYLRNRLHFRTLYPGADLSPAFEMVRYCALDPSTDTWRVVPASPRPADAVLHEVAQWVRAQDGC
jgi:glycosyltransferase involved in cell wall biosynthesis